MPRLELLEDRITPTGPTITTLASFDGASGKQPVGGLVVDSNGNLYGAAQSPNSSNKFDVYEVAKGSGTITTLAPIPNGTPVGKLIMDGSGNLYGTTQLAGGSGIIFELPHGSSAVNTLATFTSATGLAASGGLVMDGSGNLYGTTVGNVLSGPGTIFELAHGSSTITILYTFSGTNGEYESYGGLTLDGSGNLYGITPLGGASSDGTVFELAKGSKTIATLASFDGTNGALPQAGLIMDRSGNLYGTASLGGAHNNGTVFELARGSSTIATLASFNSFGSGIGPAYTDLVMDNSGNLYGTNYDDTLTDLGLIFELPIGGNTIITLASFNGANGTGPDDYPIMDSSGNLYGATIGGGADKLGTVYELQAVAPGPNLAFVQQPGNTIAGTTMPALTVAIEDQFGNIQTSDNGDKITLALGPGSPSGTLNGTTTLTVSGGEATFNDLSINQAGNGFTLAASTNAGGILSGISTSFNIAPAAADHLAFLQGPTNTAVGATIKPAVTAALEDKFGNVETGDNSDTISLALSPSAALSGTATQTLRDGEASFGDLSIGQAANGYTLTVSTKAGGIASLTSSSFNVTPAQVATTAVNATVPYSSGFQAVTFHANISNAGAAGNPVDEGSVTFTVLDGSTVIGTPVQGTVSGGAASADYTLPAGQTAGSYTLAVRYSDSQGNFTDNGDTNATLTVIRAPAVTTNPSSQTVHAGDTVAFTAAAAGFPTPTVQWQVSTDDGATFSDISGATSTTLTINTTQPSQNGYEYQAVFTSRAGTATSQAALLTILSAPALTTPPSNQTATAGQTATFTMAVNGNPTPAVQWQVSSDGGQTWTNLSDATSTTLILLNVLLAQNGNEYRAVLSNSLGAITTSAALLSVQAPLTITSGDSAVFTAGQGGSFTVTTTGLPIPTLTESGALPSGVAFTDNGNGTATLAGTPAPGTQGTYPFSIAAHNGGSDFTQNFTLTVNPAPISPPPAPPPPPPSPHQPPALNVPPLLALLGGFVAQIETINGNGTETVAYNMLGTVLIEAIYDSSGNFVSASVFGLSIPNWVWYL